MLNLLILRNIRVGTRHFVLDVVFWNVDLCGTILCIVPHFQGSRLCAAEVLAV